MTNNGHTTEPETTPIGGQASPASIEDLDLTPSGLADAPANEQDPDSIVHTGNS
jgi:hypothetical protein